MQVQFTIDRVFPREHKLTHVFVNGEAAGMLTLTSYELDFFRRALEKDGHEASVRDRVVERGTVALNAGKE
jgi:hypothetical protein